MQAASRRIVERMAAPLARMGIHPNTLTLAGLLLSVPTAFSIAIGWTIAGGLLVFFTGCFDMLDGAVARISRNGSQFGAFLDSTLDRWAEGIIFIGLIWFFSDQSARVETILAVATLIGSMLISYTRAKAESLNIQCAVGLFQRPERFLVLGLLLIGPTWFLSYGMWLMAFATQVTAVQRVLHVRRSTTN
jgi:CDP-diacylglycerol--glycerol-3-phosphate 3-phosphatidyltransferase